MKLKEGIISQEINGTYYLVDTGLSGERFNGLVKLNKTGFFVASKLLENITEDELVNSLCSEYDVSRDIAKKDIEKLLGELKRKNLINE